MQYKQAVVVGMLACFVTLQAQAQPLNLLFFGNSFTQSTQNAQVALGVGQIAIADNKLAPLIVHDLMGGQYLDYHRNEVLANPTNNVNHANIAGKTWDFVIMQGHSVEATYLSTAAEPLYKDAYDLYTAVRDHASGRGAGVEAVLYQTWARGNGHEFYDAVGDGVQEFTSPTAMHNEIRAGYANAATFINGFAGDGSARVAPVGDGFALGNPPNPYGAFDPALYDVDIYHASRFGYRLASLIIYRTIYEENVSDIPYSRVSSWVGLSAQEWTDVTTMADAVILVPEPATSGLFILGAAALLRSRRVHLFMRSRPSPPVGS